MLENDEDSVEEIGFNPKEVYEIIVQSETKLSGVQKWNEEVVPAVTERSARHSLDLGSYTGTKCVIELTIICE